jgi:hypothetical protein
MAHRLGVSTREHSVSDINKHKNVCLVCQQSKKSTNKKMLLAPLPIPGGPDLQIWAPSPDPHRLLGPMITADMKKNLCYASQIHSPNMLWSQWSQIKIQKQLQGMVLQIWHSCTNSQGQQKRVCNKAMCWAVPVAKLQPHQDFSSTPAVQCSGWSFQWNCENFSVAICNWHNT